jgi:hypothetical protein
MDRLLGKSHALICEQHHPSSVLISFSPGRFHASLVMKLVIVHLVMRYNMKLEDDKARTLWKWETFTMPYESTRFVLEER